MLSSKSGNSSRSGVTRDSSPRSCNHWPVKFDTSASARGSASMRRTCASSTPGRRRRPAVAAFSSCSSGMLLHRKKDSRDASSTSLTGCAVAGARRGRVAFHAIQERRAGQHAGHARTDARVEVAAVRRVSVCRRTAARSTSSAVDWRAGTHAASGSRRSARAHAGSSAAVAGRQTNTRSRLGELLTPLTLNGPRTLTVRRRGKPPARCTSWLSRCEVSHTSWRSNCFSRHVKPTSCVPAVTNTLPFSAPRPSS